MPASIPEKVAAVVVTYNRCALLRECLCRLLNQAYPLDRIFVIDNASTDGTAAFLLEYESHPRVRNIRAGQNLGGAGGFVLGITHAANEGYDWFWLMDDDALPEVDAWAELQAVIANKGDIYASTASDGETLCWPARVFRPDGTELTVTAYRDLQPVEQVQGVPFLGFLVHRELVERLGLPDSGFFLSGDDIEYCARARTQGAHIHLVKASRINHPVPDRRFVSILGHSVAILDLPPWKRYYDVRNRILIARRHYGGKLWAQTLPGILIRWGIACVDNPGWKQSKAFLLGLFDGLLGKTGKRWAPPGDRLDKGQQPCE